MQIRRQQTSSSKQQEQQQHEEPQSRVGHPLPCEVHKARQAPLQLCLCSCYAPFSMLQTTANGDANDDNDVEAGSCPLYEVRLVNVYFRPPCYAATAAAPPLPHTRTNKHTQETVASVSVAVFLHPNQGDCPLCSYQLYE